MSAMVSLMILLTVQEWTESEAGITARFKGGAVGLLSRTRPGYAPSVGILTSGGKAPIVVEWAGKGEIASASRARRDLVKWMVENPEGGWRLVMTKMNGTPKLLPDTPEYSRIRSVVDTSIAEHREIWVALKLPEFVLVDAQLVER
jgi:hypothetical protein